MIAESIEEIIRVIRFTLEHSFDKFDVYPKSIDSELDVEIYVIAEGVKHGEEYKFKFNYTELVEMNKREILVPFLLQKRDLLLKSN